MPSPKGLKTETVPSPERAGAVPSEISASVQRMKLREPLSCYTGRVVWQLGIVVST